MADDQGNFANSGSSGDTDTDVGSAAASTPNRALVRSRRDRKVAGVCGGVAEYLGIDPIILRIVVVVLTIFGGSGLLLYAAGWLLIADEGQERSELQKVLSRQAASGRLAVAVTVVLVLAAIVGAGRLLDGPRWLGSGPDVWPLLVVLGVGFFVWYSRRPHDHSPPAQWSPQPVPWSPSQGAGAAPAAVWAPPPTGYPAGTAGTAGTARPQPAPAPVVIRRRSVLGAATLSVAAIAAGIMLPLNHAGIWHLTAVSFLAVLLTVIGLGLVVGAFAGRSRGLIVWGVLLSLVTALAAAVPGVDAHRTGNVLWRPTSASSVPAGGYRWAAGDTQLDLTALTPGASPSVITVALGAGTLVVVVPATAQVVLDAQVGVGTIRLPDGTHVDGVGRHVTRTLEPAFGPSGTSLSLRLDVGAGTLEVRRAQA